MTNAQDPNSDDSQFEQPRLPLRQRFLFSVITPLLLIALIFLPWYILSIQKSPAATIYWVPSGIALLVLQLPVVFFKRGNRVKLFTRGVVYGLLLFGYFSCWWVAGENWHPLM